MRTTLIALAVLAALTTSSRADAQGLGGSNIGFGLPPVFVGLLVGPSAALTTAALVMDGVLIHQLAMQRAPSRGLSIVSLVLSLLSGGWNSLILASQTSESWKTWPGFPAYAIAGLTTNAASILFSLVALGLPRTPPVVVAPMVLPSGAGASLSLQW